MLDIRFQKTEKYSLGILAGRIDSEGATLLEKTFPEGQGDSGHLILDLSATTFLSSLGMRTLVRLKKAVSRNNRLLLLVGVQPFVMDVLRMTGLMGVFVFVADMEAALAQVGQFQQEESTRLGEATAESQSYRWSVLDSGPSILEVWGDGLDRKEEGTSPAKAFTTVTLAELGLAWGIGGLGSRPEDASDAAGPFLSAGSWVVVQPASSPSRVDFLLAPQPSDAYFHVRQAISCAGKPACRLQTASGSASGEELLRYASAQIRRLQGGSLSNPFAFLLAGRKGDCRLLVAGLWFETGNLAAMPLDPDGLQTIGRPYDRAGFPDHILGIAFSFPASDTSSDLPDDLPSLLATSMSMEVEPFLTAWDIREEWNAPVLWIFGPSSLLRAADRRLQIQRTDGEAFSYEWECLVRSIYTDSHTILADPLPGGYSSTTFRVSGCDHGGRKMLPTVLKISTLDWIHREESAYHTCVKNFILNNAAVIMGKAQMGPWAALRYNFVGLDGPETRLTWLGEHLLKRPFAEVSPIFQSLFGKILLPWYGQTRQEPTPLFRDHDPRGLFPRMEEDAWELLGIRPDQERIACPELSMELPNPYRFLRLLFDERHGETRFLHRSITHGDLNLNNILIDEKENIYVIDFSETSIRNVASDFARMEALVMLQMTRLETEEDMYRIVSCLRAMTEIDSLQKTPSLFQASDDPMLEKAVQLTGLLRNYAAGYAPGQKDLWAYWLPLLQWSAPIVSFRQFPARRKRLAAIASALICRRLEESES